LVLLLLLLLVVLGLAPMGHAVPQLVYGDSGKNPLVAPACEA